MVEHKGPRAWLQSANSKLSRLQKRPPQDSEDISARENAINSKTLNSPSPTIGQAVEPPRGRIELPGDQVAANIGDTGQDTGSSKDGHQLQEHQAPVDSDSPDLGHQKERIEPTQAFHHRPQKVRSLGTRTPLFGGHYGTRPWKYSRPRTKTSTTS
jgi:hypothetical protein